MLLVTQLSRFDNTGVYLLMTEVSIRKVVFPLGDGWWSIRPEGKRVRLTEETIEFFGYAIEGADTSVCVYVIIDFSSWLSVQDSPLNHLTQPPILFPVPRAIKGSKNELYFSTADETFLVRSDGTIPKDSITNQSVHITQPVLTSNNTDILLTWKDTARIYFRGDTAPVLPNDYTTAVFWPKLKWTFDYDYSTYSGYTVLLSDSTLEVPSTNTTRINTPSLPFFLTTHFMCNEFHKGQVSVRSYIPLDPQYYGGNTTTAIDIPSLRDLIFKFFSMYAEGLTNTHPVGICTGGDSEMTKNAFTDTDLDVDTLRLLSQHAPCYLPTCSGLMNGNLPLEQQTILGQILNRSCDQNVTVCIPTVGVDDSVVKGNIVVTNFCGGGGGGGDGGGGGSGGGGGGSAKPSGARVAQTAAAAERALTNLSTQGVLRLRQACCHPQLGSFGIRGSRRGGGGAGAGLADPMSMREILGKLIEEEKNRCEEEQRKVLFNLSALAGMRAMVGEHAAAAERYAEALEGSEANRQPMPLDTYVEPTFIGPTSLRFQAPSVAQRSGRTFGPIRWQLPSMGAPAAISADQTADAAAAGDAEAAWAAETSSGNVWVRIELSKPRRLSEVRMGITLTLTPTLTLTLVDSRR